MGFVRFFSNRLDTRNALLAAAGGAVNRDDMAEYYADCLRCKRATGKDCDWKAINAAILRRWPRGLLYIKRLAWKLAEAN